MAWVSGGGSGMLLAVASSFGGLSLALRKLVRPLR